MAPTTPIAFATHPINTQAEGELKATVVQEMPIDGSVKTPIAPADQNAFLLVAAPMVLLVAGAILYLATRGKADTSVDTPKSGGEKGGLWMMGIGAVLTGLMLVYLMLVQ
jgi:hypothetical protein